MRTDIPADIVDMFQAKYDWLKSKQGGVSTLEGAIEPGIYKTPDGGWQCNYGGAWGYGCAITLRPGETEPHEVHGQICKRWYQEGGAFDENCKRGWLGYPVSDEEVYEGDGNLADRISHFENGDIIWSENTKETRTVKKRNMEMTALSAKRLEMIKPLEGLRGIVKRPVNGLTESRVNDMERTIDAIEQSIRYDRYRVTVFGAFSSGKSTLLNALMGTDYLPSADLPTTNITTEIFRSARFYLFMPRGDILEAQIKEALRNEISKDVSGGTFLEGLERDGQMIKGVGIAFEPNDSRGFRQAIAQLASEQRRDENALSRFKKQIRDGQGSVLQLGIPDLPEWLGEITLTDAPGAGSVYKGHESIIDDIIPKTQLVLYVVESPKAGSSVDEWLCNRIVNSYHRKVFFVLNKTDQQNNDEIDDALAELKEHIPFVNAGTDGEPIPPRPEFLKTSVLCETMANRLADGSATIADFIDSKKLSVSKLLVSEERTKAANENERKNAAIRFLRKQSQFDKLRERIKSYLHEENKELPFCERAEVLVKTFGQEMDTVCKASISALRTDKSDKALEDQQHGLRRQRERSAKEAENALKDFRESALRPETGILSKVESGLSMIPGAVAEKLEKVLADSGEFKRLTANKGERLKNWLAREVSDRMEPISRNLDRELRAQGAHLIKQLRPILEKIDEATLAHQYDGLQQDNEHDTAKYSGIGNDAEQDVLVTAMSAGVAGGALATVLGVTAGSVTTSVAGTGLAGMLGTGTLASLAASLGFGNVATTVSTAPFWGLGLGPAIAIVAVPVLALSIAGVFLAKNIIRKKIVEKVRLELRKQILGEEGASVHSKLKEKVAVFVNESVDGFSKNLDSYLGQLDQQEKKILADAVKAKDDKGKKEKALEAFREEVKSFVESSVQTLQELNPGKEAAHV